MADSSTITTAYSIDDAEKYQVNLKLLHKIESLIPKCAREFCIAH